MSWRDDDHETDEPRHGTGGAEGEAAAAAERDDLEDRLSALEASVASTRRRQQQLVAALERVDGAGAVRASRGDGSSDDDAPPLLTDLPAGYAGDALVMEWLAALVADVGPAGALRAVDYYEDVGWISEDVRDGLVEVLAGTELDVDVDPARPTEPDAIDHAESYQYVRTLAQLADR